MRMLNPPSSNYVFVQDRDGICILLPSVEIIKKSKQKKGNEVRAAYDVKLESCMRIDCNEKIVQSFSYFNNCLFVMRESPDVYLKIQRYKVENKEGGCSGRKMTSISTKFPNTFDDISITSEGKVALCSSANAAIMISNTEFQLEIERFGGFRKGLQDGGKEHFTMIAPSSICWVGDDLWIVDKGGTLPGSVKVLAKLTFAVKYMEMVSSLYRCVEYKSERVATSIVQSALTLEETISTMVITYDWFKEFYNVQHSVIGIHGKGPQGTFPKDTLQGS